MCSPSLLIRTDLYIVLVYVQTLHCMPQLQVCSLEKKKMKKVNLKKKSMFKIIYRQAEWAYLMSVLNNFNQNFVTALPFKGSVTSLIQESKDLHGPA